ncbi:MAG: MFS transporter [Peptidiphaga sp.]
MHCRPSPQKPLTERTERTSCQPSAGRRWAVLGIVSVALFLISIDGSVLFTALPVLSKDLGATAGQQLWILNAYTVVMSGLLLGAGTLGDKLGHRRMFLFGMAVFGVASLACALAYSPGTLIAARVLLAVGAAPMMPATLALIRLTFTDARQRNTAIAVWSMVSVVGAVVGPVVGGLLLEHFHWGSVFLVNVPLIVAAIALGAAVIPRDEPDRSRPWDAVSSLLATVALAAGVLAVEEAARVPPSWAKVAAGLAIAAVLGAAFVRRQRRLDDPLLPLDVFAIPRFTAGVVAAVVTLVAVSGLGLVVAQRFQLVAGYSPFQAGLLLVVLAVGALPSSLVGGMLLNRIGERAPIVWGFAVGALGASIALLGVDSPGWFVAGLVVTGIGLGAPASVASSAIVTSVPASRAGMASSVEEVSYEFGNVLATAFFGGGILFVYGLAVDLPAGAPAGAATSLNEALRVSSDPRVVSAAVDAYDTAFAVVLAAVALVCLVGASVVSRLLRETAPGGADEPGGER